MSGFVQVGRVKDAHGVKGELFITLFAGEAAWLEKLKEIRLINPNADNSLCVLSAKSVRLHKNGLIAKSEELKNRNEAEALKGWLFEIPKEFLRSEPGEAIFLQEIHGFRVITQAQGEVGTITGFGSNGIQDLLNVATKHGEYEVPFVEAFVQKIDYKAREIHMDLPEGLLGELDRDEVQ